MRLDVSLLWVISCDKITRSLRFTWIAIDEKEFLSTANTFKVFCSAFSPPTIRTIEELKCVNHTCNCVDTELMCDVDVVRACTLRLLYEAFQMLWRARLLALITRGFVKMNEFRFELTYGQENRRLLIYMNFSRRKNGIGRGLVCVVNVIHICSK